MKHYLQITSGIIFMVFGFSVQALDVKLTPNQDYIEVVHNGNTMRVQRIQDQEHEITGSFAKTSRKCPPFCPQPLYVASNVHTVGEIEIFKFMENQLKNATGLLIDARLPDWHKKGTIPGSINLPFTVFEKDKNDSELVSAMQKLGVTPKSAASESSFLDNVFGNSDNNNPNWDFSHAKELILWCNGPWCGQSPHAIRALLKHGYPANKLYYYRGGMQMWQILGLITAQ